MTVNQAVTAFAGFMVLLSLALAWSVSPYFLALTAFVGANLFQSAFTGFCPLAKVLKALGARPSSETFKYQEPLSFQDWRSKFTG